MLPVWRSLRTVLEQSTEDSRSADVLATLRKWLVWKKKNNLSKWALLWAYSHHFTLLQTAPSLWHYLILTLEFMYSYAQLYWVWVWYIMPLHKYHIQPYFKSHCFTQLLTQLLKRNRIEKEDWWYSKKKSVYTRKKTMKCKFIIIFNLFRELSLDFSFIVILFFPLCLGWNQRLPDPDSRVQWALRQEACPSPAQVPLHGLSDRLHPCPLRSK